MLGKLKPLQDFACLANETINVTARTELSLFIRYVNNDNYCVEEDFLLSWQCKQKVLRNLARKLPKYRQKRYPSVTPFSSVAWMEQIAWVARYPDYNITFIIKHPIQSMLIVTIIIQNYFFVHLIKQFLGIALVDETVLLLFQFSNRPRGLNNLTPLEMLKMATTCWLSRTMAIQPIITRYKNVIDAFDTIYQEKRNPEVKRIWDTFLRSHLILNMLFVADVLVPLNGFSCFLQFKSLVFADVSVKLKHLKFASDKLESDDGSLF